MSQYLASVLEKALKHSVDVVSAVLCADAKKSYHLRIIVQSYRIELVQPNLLVEGAEGTVFAAQEGTLNCVVQIDPRSEDSDDNLPVRRVL